MQARREALGCRVASKPLVVVANAVALCRNFGRADDAFELCAVPR